ncbi:Cu(I)-responsive transcriptional regulator [Rodentibacter pneumotropicus]|uniref:Cu(I)-responsive transcriptional regulator n=1 Tax=Rodentibacter pneumotropicus TaxID=758 RepID=A0AAW5LJA6_9PAST|nr:Cu(I)-responsive transcriptional regulator [Rodentibacter pneumotropicus]MCQ9122361.1 Cu(I)-responsive transcriptional regulator [Rodentibacter pneumotropicus]OOF63840.1 Cu(I)-responsive transcriptional regulator [Rodentibacter pneumotropicus]OOF67506.1 Cu(I)-responsive transcriptional regulator [Rodentibacter pneumotropicus]THA19020.1 Cu(I)-responsive transcriptional regulator [Rodentibacter pneumotropicus]
MNISEAAKLSGLTTKQIRDYEKLGLLKPAKRNFSGYRHYEEKDIERLHFIRHSRNVGFSLQQIGQLLALQDNPARNSSEVKALTAKHIATLKQQIKQLEEMVKELQAWYDACQGNNCPECPILDGLKEEN